MNGTLCLKKFLRYNRYTMANVFIKSDEKAEYIAELLRTYIRMGTVHNISVHEKNADFCISMSIPPYPASNGLKAYTYNNNHDLEALSSKIFYQFEKAGLLTTESIKMSIPREEYDKQFVVQTIVLELTNDQREIDEETFAVAIGQAIVYHFDPSATFETFSSKKKDKTVKRPQDKRYTDRKFVGEPTSNSKLLFKKS